MRNVKLAIWIVLFMLNADLVLAQNTKTAAANDSTIIKAKIAKDKADYEKWLKLDWPNLKRYSESNTKLGLPAANEKRVVFMGNSITDGWVRTAPEFFDGRPYIGRGIGGQTTPQMLVRFRADVVNLKPKVVVILAGTNDIAGNSGPSTLEMIQDNLASMADLAKANGIKVILCSILPAYDYPWKPGLKPYEKIRVMNKWIKAYATKKGFIYLDYYSAMVDNRPGLKVEYSSDGVHPNKLGYSIMAPLAEKAIAKALGK
ncbi:MAG: SGNH/GDSL hydrolase family protein [Mariniphaga sp.]